MPRFTYPLGAIINYFPENACWRPHFGCFSNRYFFFFFFLVEAFSFALEHLNWRKCFFFFPPFLFFLSDSLCSFVALTENEACVCSRNILFTIAAVLWLLTSIMCYLAVFCHYFSIFWVSDTFFAHLVSFESPKNWLRSCQMVANCACELFPRGRTVLQLVFWHGLRKSKRYQIGIRHGQLLDWVEWEPWVKL